MKFVFNLFNHNNLGQRSLHDVLGIMAHQLQALGHVVEWDRDNRHLIKASQGYNILVEGFTSGEKGTIPCVAKAHAEGARFIFVATEEPTDRGFNHGTQKEMVMRLGTFVEASQYADAILHLVPGERVTQWFSRLKPAAYAELGYAPTLVRSLETKPPEFDFGFFGSLSNRRHSILKNLSRRLGTNIRVVADFPSQETRDAIMKQVKVILQIRKFDKMGLVSSSRCNTALCVGRPVLAEPHELSEPWNQIIHFSDSLDDFYAKAAFFKAAWRGIHEAQFCRFRDIMTPERCVGKPLRDVGILDGAAKAAAAA